MKLKLSVWQCGLACLVWAIVCCHKVVASGLQVSPVTLILQGTQNADGIWLSNEGDREINAQVRVYRWSQSDFSDRLSPSKGLVISPPMLTLRPGERQLIRVIRAEPRSDSMEDAYRLSINELPTIPLEKNKLQFVLHYSLPVFIRLSNISPFSSKLRWTVSRNGGSTFIEVCNQGNSHAQLSAATFINSQGARRVITTGLLGYVLPGSTMRWRLPISVGDVPQGSKLNVTINGQKTEQIL